MKAGDVVVEMVVNLVERSTVEAEIREQVADEIMDAADRRFTDGDTASGMAAGMEWAADIARGSGR